MIKWLKNRFRKIALPLGFLACMFALGLFFGLNSWDKNLYVEWNPSTGRGIAGEDSSAEILNLSSTQLIQKPSTALFSKSQIIRENGLIAFYLGNFLTPDSTKDKQKFICQTYPLVEFSFSAIGLNISGEEALMLIQSPCNMESTHFLGPFWIPFEEILAQPSKKFFEMPEQETFIQFYNVSVLLAEDWLLKSVRFFKEGTKDEEFLIQFNPDEDGPSFEFNLKPAQTLSPPQPVEN